MGVSLHEGFMTRIIGVLLLIPMINSCSIISNNLGVHKVTSGFSTQDREAGTSWFELTYHGKENDSINAATDQWYYYAARACKHKNNSVKSLSLIAELLISGDSEHFNELYVNYPEYESHKWPQVTALLKC